MDAPKSRCPQCTAQQTPSPSDDYRADSLDPVAKFLAIADRAVGVLASRSSPVARRREINGEHGNCSLHRVPSLYNVTSAHKIGHSRGENRRFLDTLL